MTAWGMRPRSAAPNKAPVAKETMCGTRDSRCFDGSARNNPAARQDSTPDAMVATMIQRRVFKRREC